jgi:hypothetical protein
VELVSRSLSLARQIEEIETTFSGKRTARIRGGNPKLAALARDLRH